MVKRKLLIYRSLIFLMDFFMSFGKNGGRGRIRTAVQAFAELCLATRPRDHHNFKELCKYTYIF